MSIHIINPINPYNIDHATSEKGMLAKNHLNHRLTIASVDTHVIAMEGRWEIPWASILQGKII